MNYLERLDEALQKGDLKNVEKFTQEAIDDGFPPDIILTDGLIAGLEKIGKLFKKGEVFIPEMLIVAKAMHAGLEVLKPILAVTSQKSKGKIVLGTVKGDLHDIGKNLVRMMLSGAGFEVTDLGIDVPVEKFIAAANNEAVNIIAMSALLTTTLPKMQETIDALKNTNGNNHVKILIGGAPVTQEYADDIGADAYGTDAADAVEKALSLMKA